MSIYKSKYKKDGANRKNNRSDGTQEREVIKDWQSLDDSGVRIRDTRTIPKALYVLYIWRRTDQTDECSNGRRSNYSV